MRNVHTSTAGLTEYPAVTTAARAARRMGIWWHRFQKRRRVRRTERALMALSDHTLKDIGIDRSEAGPVARRQR
jgi:uncharacterized protein YjiS (DUF1127 family)